MECGKLWQQNYKAGLDALAEHRLENAEQWFISAVRQLETADEPEHLADVLRQLVSTRRSLGRVGAAAEDLWRLLELQERVSGKHSREVARTLRDLAELCKEMGLYVEAESLLWKSNHILGALMDMCIADVADSYDILADICKAQGRLEDAERYGKLAAIDRKVIWGSDGRSSIESLGCYLEAMVESVGEILMREPQARTKTRPKGSRKMRRKNSS